MNQPAMTLAAARLLGAGLHVPMLGIFIVQGLNVPTEGVLFLVALWLALLLALVILWRRGTLWIAAVPVVDVLLVYAVTAVGRAVFGWQG